MPATWLVLLAWVALALAFASAAYIAYVVWGRGFRQPMGVMEAVWPVTALYFGPLAVWDYHRFGRPNANKWLRENDRDEPPDQPRWATIATGVSHCGAGCTLGDIIAVFFALGLVIAGAALYPEYIGDYILAVGLGLAFQYLAIVPMRGVSFRKGIMQAAHRLLAHLHGLRPASRRRHAPVTACSCAARPVRAYHYELGGVAPSPCQSHHPPSPNRGTRCQPACHPTGGATRRLCRRRIDSTSSTGGEVSHEARAFHFCSSVDAGAHGCGPDRRRRDALG